MASQIGLRKGKESIAARKAAAEKAKEKNKGGSVLTRRAGKIPSRKTTGKAAGKASDNAKKQAATGKKTAAVSTAANDTITEKKDTSSDKKALFTKVTEIIPQESSVNKRVFTEDEGERTRINYEVHFFFGLGIAVFLTLCNLHMCNSLGEVIHNFMYKCFGTLAYVLPVYGFIVYLFLLSNEGSREAWIRFRFSLYLMFLCCCFLQLCLVKTENYDAASNTQVVKTVIGGGILGEFVAGTLQKMIGTLATAMIILMLILICIIILGQRSVTTTVRQTAGGLMRFGQKFLGLLFGTVETERFDSEPDEDPSQRQEDAEKDAEKAHFDERGNRPAVQKNDSVRRNDSRRTVHLNWNGMKKKTGISHFFADGFPFEGESDQIQEERAAGPHQEAQRRTGYGEQAEAQTAAARETGHTEKGIYAEEDWRKGFSPTLKESYSTRMEIFDRDREVTIFRDGHPGSGIPRVQMTPESRSFTELGFTQLALEPEGEGQYPEERYILFNGLEMEPEESDIPENTHEDTYKAAYEDSYKDSYKDTRGDSYRDSYKDTCGDSYRDSYKDTRGDSYRDSHKDTRGDSYRDSYEDTHGDSYRDSYEDTRGDSYRDSYKETHGDSCNDTYEDTYGDSYKDTCEDSYEDTYGDFYEDSDKETYEDSVEWYEKDADEEAEMPQSSLTAAAPYTDVHAVSADPVQEESSKLQAAAQETENAIDLTEHVVLPDDEPIHPKQAAAEYDLFKPEDAGRKDGYRHNTGRKDTYLQNPGSRNGLRDGRPSDTTGAARPVQNRKTSSGIWKESGAQNGRDSSGAVRFTDMTAAPVKKKPAPKPYVFPETSLLKKNDIGSGSIMPVHRETQKKLFDTLQSFGVRVRMGGISVGPTVTRFELEPEPGVKVSRIVALQDDIKLALAAADIRIEAPIPGKSAIGIEVPNRHNTIVGFRELIESEKFKKASSRLTVAVGRDISGAICLADLAKMPHLLIAGATGSGKSVCINTLVMSIIYKAKPEEVKLIMVDPKVVELSVYNGIPHLLVPVVTDARKAANALNWAVEEMNCRYKKFAECNTRNIEGYNEKLAELKKTDPSNEEPFMYQMVIIVDELADLMMVSPGEVEEAICRLAQMARAAGIYLVLATQRPSVNVITGLIKANVPSRIAFAVSSGVDSRTIIDMNGAEKLLGKGDMLFYPNGIPKPVRVQGAFISDEEVYRVVKDLHEKNVGQTGQEMMEKMITSATESNAARSERDEYFESAARFIIEKDKASIGALQRNYRIGFNRAARLMDQLAAAGVVGEEDGTKPRKILMSMEEFEAYINA